MSSGTSGHWITSALLPAVNLALALLLSAAVILLIGESPVRALRLLATGAAAALGAAWAFVSHGSVLQDGCGSGANRHANRGP